MKKKMNSKLIKCTLPFPRVNASQQKHSTVNNFKHKYDFLNMEKQLDLGKICFLLKKKNDSWHSKDFDKNWHKTNFEAEKARKLIKELTKM